LTQLKIIINIRNKTTKSIFGSSVDTINRQFDN